MAFPNQKHPKGRIAKEIRRYVWDNGNLKKRLVRKYKPQDITNQSEMLDGHEWIMAMLNTPTLTTQTQPLWVSKGSLLFPISSLPGFPSNQLEKVTRYLKSKR